MKTEFEDFTNTNADHADKSSFDDILNETFGPGSTHAERQPSNILSENELSFNTDTLFCAAPVGDTDLSGNPLRRIDDHELLTDIRPNARREVLLGGNLSANTIEAMRYYLFDRAMGSWQYGLRAGWLQAQLGSGFSVEDVPGRRIPTMNIRYNNRTVGTVVR